DRYEHNLAVSGEGNITRPVTAAPQSTSAGQIGHHYLSRAARLQVSLLIRKADYGIGIGDVNELRVQPRRVESDSEGLCQSARKDLSLFRRTIAADAPENLDLARVAFGHKEISIWRGADQPRIV